MNEERVRVAISDEGVVEVALVRSDKFNALEDAAMFEALRAAIERLQHTPNLRAVVLHSEARAKAQQIAACSPDAVRAAKRLLLGASPVDAGAVLRAESIEQQRLIGSPNQVEAVAAALQRRTPRFTP